MSFKGWNTIHILRQRESFLLNNTTTFLAVLLIVRTVVMKWFHGRWGCVAIDYVLVCQLLFAGCTTRGKG